MSLQGKVAFITGGTRGIGRATARHLATQGCDIAVTYLSSRDSAQEAVEEFEAMGVRARSFRGNVGNAEQLRRTVDTVAEEMGGVDILVSNAATGALKPIMELDEKDWDRTMHINARALLVAAQAAAPHMKEKGWGRIVALTSQGSTHVIPNYGAVGMAKAALEAVVRYLAVALAPTVRVNAVSGGVVDTQSLRRIPGSDVMLKESAARTPLGRVGTPDDIAKVVAFLCSEEADWICGQVIRVDGGYSLGV